MPAPDARSGSLPSDGLLPAPIAPPHAILTPARRSIRTRTPSRWSVGRVSSFPVIGHLPALPVEGLPVGFALLVALLVRRVTAAAAAGRRAPSPRPSFDAVPNPLLPPVNTHNVPPPVPEEAAIRLHSHSRRLHLSHAGSLALLWPIAAEASTSTRLPSDVFIPMIYMHGAYCCEYMVEGGRPALALVDTGSPFLVMPAYLNAPKPKRSRYRPTYEMYASEEGAVTWHEGTIVLPTMSMAVALPRVVYGVFRTYQDNGGGAGVLLGLIRHRQRSVRPTFLEQSNVHSFRLDFRLRVLTLAPRPLMPAHRDSIPLVNLRDVFGCTVQHYVCMIHDLTINGKEIRPPQPIYGLIDTGCTGMLVNSSYYFPLRSEAGGFSSLALTLRTAAGRSVSLTASRRDPRFLVLPATFPWLPADACLMVIGMAFLQQKVVTIDTVGSRMTIDL